MEKLYRIEKINNVAIQNAAEKLQKVKRVKNQFPCPEEKDTRGYWKKKKQAAKGYVYYRTKWGEKSEITEIIIELNVEQLNARSRIF